MALKTVLRKMCNVKYLPMSGKVASLLRTMDTFEGVIDAESQDIRDTARHQLEAGKTLADHIEDVTGRAPITVLHQHTSTTAPLQATLPGDTETHDSIALPQPFRQLRFSRKDLEGMDQETFIGHIDTLLEAQGLTLQQRSAWKGKFNRKHKTKAFRDLPRDILIGLYIAMQAKALTRETGHEAASTGEHAAQRGDVTPDSSPAATPTEHHTDATDSDSVSSVTSELSAGHATPAAPQASHTDEPAAFTEDDPEDLDDHSLEDMRTGHNHPPLSTERTQHAREHVSVVAVDFLASPDALRLRTDLLTLSQGLTSLWLREEIQALVEDASTPETILRQKFDEVAQALDAEAVEQELPF